VRVIYLKVPADLYQRLTLWEGRLRLFMPGENASMLTLSALLRLCIEAGMTQLLSSRTDAEVASAVVKAGIGRGYGRGNDKRST
jgi:hypothetical protein